MEKIVQVVFKLGVLMVVGGLIAYIGDSVYEIWHPTSESEESLWESLSPSWQIKLIVTGFMVILFAGITYACMGYMSSKK